MMEWEWLFYGGLVIDYLLKCLMQNRDGRAAIYWNDNKG